MRLNTLKLAKYRRPFIACLLTLFLMTLPVQPLFASSDILPTAELFQTARGQVSGGLVHSLFIHLDGRLFVMGDNSFGQLGTGMAVDQQEPVFIALPEDAAAVSAGAYHSLVLSISGNVYSFGRNAFGQLGSGTIDNGLTPQRIEDLPKAAAIAAGAYHSLILTADGSVWAFGNNAEGQCGPALSESVQNEKGVLVARRVIRPQEIITDGAVAIAAGASHSLVLMADGQVMAFGDNSHGQLGDGTTQGHQEPAPVKGITQATHIAAGSDHSLILETNTTQATVQQILYAFGDNSLGQVGIGSSFAPNAAVLSPTVVDWRKAVSKHIYLIQSINAGYGNSLLVLTRQDPEANDPRTAKILLWGSNAFGQLGDGGSISIAVPRPLKASDQGYTGDLYLPFDSTAIGGGHILIFSSRGLLGAAGRNDNGQTGLPTSQNPSRFAGIGLPELEEPVLLSGSSESTVDAGKVKAALFGTLLNDEPYMIALQVPWDTTDIFGPGSIRPPSDLRMPILIGSSVLIVLAAGLAILYFHRRQKRHLAEVPAGCMRPLPVKSNHMDDETP